MLHIGILMVVEPSCSSISGQEETILEDLSDNPPGSGVPEGVRGLPFKIKWNRPLIHAPIYAPALPITEI